MKSNPAMYAEYLLLALGVLLWVVALTRGRALEWFTSPGQLPAWRIPATEFATFVVAVLVASVLAIRSAVWAFHLDVSTLPPTPRTTLIAGLALQLAWLAVGLGFRLLPTFRPPRGGIGAVSAVWAGFAAVLLSLPAVETVSEIWIWVLQRLRLPTDLQEAVDIIRQANGVGELLWWGGLIVVVAPLAEEFLFRGLLYRFFRSHMPDTAAMIGSSMIFGMLHGNLVSAVPLMALGVALCLSFRYTGRLLTPIVMHALFNLNTLLQVRMGVST